MDIKKILMTINKKNALYQLSQKYGLLLEKLFQEGGYIWGTGQLGKFAGKQCNKNDIKIKGYIDNNKLNWNVSKHIFSCDVLEVEDIIIIASLYYSDIIEQLESMGIMNYIYYEELATLVDEMDTYSITFKDIFGELEINSKCYREIYDLFADDLSKEVYKNIILYRNTLDVKYTKKAFELSLKEGEQDLDRIILNRLDKEYTFYDVGGYDGKSTMEYISHVEGYRKIYFFEPDKVIMEEAKKILINKENIVFIQAGVGAKNEYKNYNAIGGGAGTFLNAGNDVVEVVALDNFVDSHKSYIKMDIEGYELQALKGAENCIKQYAPLLSISVYHIPGDIHRIIQLILSWEPNYKVYMRHYANSYVDTRVYFVND